MLIPLSGVPGYFFVPPDNRWAWVWDWPGGTGITRVRKTPGKQIVVVVGQQLVNYTETETVGPTWLDLLSSYKGGKLKGKCRPTRTYPKLTLVACCMPARQRGKTIAIGCHPLENVNGISLEDVDATTPPQIAESFRSDPGFYCSKQTSKATLPVPADRPLRCTELQRQQRSKSLSRG